MAKLKPEQTQATFQRLTDAASYATGVLNQLFGYGLEVLNIELLAEDYYWGGEKIRVPPVHASLDIDFRRFERCALIPAVFGVPKLR